MLQQPGQILARHPKVLPWFLGAVPFTFMLGKPVFVATCHATSKEFGIISKRRGKWAPTHQFVEKLPKNDLFYQAEVKGIGGVHG